MKFEEAGPSQPSPDFATTQWSVVVQAGGGNGGDARVALEQLCQRYWYPLYVYIRSRIGNSTDAQDITQEFFARFLEKELVVQARPDRGRFRNF
jgi:RNA polymerase sigma-70 factor (ECF subfamily)